MVGLEHADFPLLEDVDILDYLGINHRQSCSLASLILFADRTITILQQDVFMTQSNRVRVPQHLDLQVAREIKRLLQCFRDHRNDELLRDMLRLSKEGHQSTWNPWVGPYNPGFDKPLPAVTDTSLRRGTGQDRAPDQTHAGASTAAATEVVQPTAPIDDVEIVPKIEQEEAPRLNEYEDTMQGVNREIEVVTISDSDDGALPPVPPTSTTGQTSGPATDNVTGEAQQQVVPPTSSTEVNERRPDAPLSTPQVADPPAAAETSQGQSASMPLPANEQSLEAPLSAPQASAQFTQPLPASGQTLPSTLQSSERRRRPFDDNDLYSLKDVRGIADAGEVVVGTIQDPFGEKADSGRLVVGKIGSDGEIVMKVLDQDIEGNELGPFFGPAEMNQEMFERHGTYRGRLLNGVSHDPSLVGNFIEAASKGLKNKDWPGREYSPTPETPTKKRKTSHFGSLGTLNSPATGPQSTTGSVVGGGAGEGGDGGSDGAEAMAE